MWASLWSNAFQAALLGQDARWDLLFALPVIDLMSVEPERTSELKVRNIVGTFIGAQESMISGFRV
jgi:hypothetical protein